MLRFGEKEMAEKSFHGATKLLEFGMLMLMI